MTWREVQHGGCASLFLATPRLAPQLVVSYRRIAPTPLCSARSRVDHPTQVASARPIDLSPHLRSFDLSARLASSLLDHPAQIYSLLSDSLRHAVSSPPGSPQL